MKTLILATFLAFAIAADCMNDDIGQPAIPDMTAPYQGNADFPGGLYACGSNVRPSAHEALGIAEAALILPRLPDGTVHLTQGRIGLITLGPSNAEQLSMSLRSQLVADVEVSKKVRLVEACQFGKTLDLTVDPNDSYWTSNVPTALAHNGITAAQVQVAWIMGAIRFPDDWPPFPYHVDEMTNLWIEMLQLTKSKFPNLKIAYLSPLQYIGYSAQPDTILGEPFAFEQGFSARNVITRQIAGDAELNADPAAGPVLVPWIDHAYLWCNGVVPRSDGLTWLCPTDCAGDGIHLSQAGGAKLATLLRTTWKADPVAQPWLLQ